jgi:gamma-glutamyltranspeptidase
MPDGVRSPVRLSILTIAQSHPLASNIMQHPELAATFEAVAEHGHDGFYKGRIAQGQLVAK